MIRSPLLCIHICKNLHSASQEQETNSQFDLHLRGLAPQKTRLLPEGPYGIGLPSRDEAGR